MRFLNHEPITLFDFLHYKYLELSPFLKTFIAQKLKFCIKDFLRKCDQIRSFFMENVIFCPVVSATFFVEST